MKYIFKLAIIIALGFGLSGCGTMPLPGKVILEASEYHNLKLSSGPSIINVPNIGSISKTEIGENLYKKVYSIQHNTYDIKIKKPLKGNLKPEGSYIRVDTSQVRTLYKWRGYNAVCLNAGYDVIEKRPTKICAIDLNKSGELTAAAYSYKDITYPLVSPVKYEISRKPNTFIEDSFKYEALYQGKIGNKIKISFREFKNDMARPAFTQDIEYELEKDGTAMVGFKGLRIQVLKATNLDITYKVIKDYN